MKFIIRSFSVPTEFCLVIFIGFGITTAGTLLWLIDHVSAVPAPPTDLRLDNASVVEGVILRLVTLGIILWIGNIRGWSLKAFGLRLSWKNTAAGVLLFLAFLVIQRILGFAIREIFHGTVDFHRAIAMTLPFVILICVVNPVFEEALECGYFFQALQRHGMWTPVFASAAFRSFLHASMGINGVVFMFAEGLLHGFVYWRWRQLWPLILAHGLQMLWSLLPRTSTF